MKFRFFSSVVLSRLPHPLHYSSRIYFLIGFSWHLGNLSEMSQLSLSEFWYQGGSFSVALPTHKQHILKVGQPLSTKKFGFPAMMLFIF